MKRRSEGGVYILWLTDRLAERERKAGEGGIPNEEDHFRFEPQKIRLLQTAFSCPCFQRMTEIDGTTRAMLDM